MLADLTKTELQLQQHQRKLDRMKQHFESATEEQAEQLGRAYAQYPWVNPEIVTTLVLFGNADLLPNVGEQIARETMRTGNTIHKSRQWYIRKKTAPLRLRRV
jgi:hypothetical protein